MHDYLVAFRILRSESEPKQKKTDDDEEELFVQGDDEQLSCMDILSDSNDNTIKLLLKNIGDGYCDDPLNKYECAYDGGDCCEQSCDGSKRYQCGESQFDCKDPRYSQNSDVPTVAPTGNRAAVPTTTGTGSHKILREFTTPGHFAATECRRTRARARSSNAQ